METSALLTAEELLALKLPNKRTELVRGRLVVREPAGYQHGVIAAAVCARLHAFVHPLKIGVVVAAETGFKLFANPDTVRAPDAGFITAARAPDPRTRGYPFITPDLCVEVLSPDDRPGEVLEKVGDWLNAGARLVWIIDPIRRRGRAYRADGSEELLDDEDSFRGEDVLPGFICRLTDVL